MTYISIRSLLIFSLMSFCSVLLSYAQDKYPSKPVTIIVPYPAGGTTDIVGRKVSEQLQNTLGQPFIVENKGGVNGTIGTKLVIGSKPDGYTLVLGSSGSLTSGYAGDPKTMGYNPFSDLIPISLLAKVPLVLVATKNFPADSFSKFLDYARSHPGKVKVASIGPGGSNTLAATLLEAKTNIELLTVPYKGTGQIMTDLIGGVVDIFFDQLSTSEPQIRAGKLKLLAVTSLERVPQFPEIPTLAELGIADFEVYTYFGLLGPKGLPHSIVKILNQSMNNLLGETGLPAAFRALKIEPAQPGSETVLYDFMKKDYDQWMIGLTAKNKK